VETFSKKVFTRVTVFLSYSQGNLIGGGLLVFFDSLYYFQLPNSHETALKFLRFIKQSNLNYL